MHTSIPTYHFIITHDLLINTKRHFIITDMHMTNRSTQKQHLIVTNMHISLRLEAYRQINFKDAEKGLVEEGFHPGKLYLQVLNHLWV